MAREKSEEGDDKRDSSKSRPDKNSTTITTQKRSWFAVPPLIRYLFDRTPVVTYNPNDLPLRSPRARDENVLYIFTHPSNPASNAPSYNPGCLKWQTLIKIYGIPFTTVPSSNHASPTGALPFLLPASSHGTAIERRPASPTPITTQTLPSYLREHAPKEHRRAVPPSALHITLLTPIRRAYLHALYLHPPTFDSTVRRLYIEPTTTNRIVRDVQAHQLRVAAREEVTQDSNAATRSVDGGALLEEAAEALKGLSTILGEGEWLGVLSTPEQEGAPDVEARTEAERVPGMLDASVFAYTHVILHVCAREPEDSPARRLADVLQKRKDLTAHRDRVLQRYYPEVEI